jgi:gamma-glutamyl hydrolase
MPGGGLSLQSNTTYYQTAQFIFQSAINAYHNKDYFPLWGTCMGFQLLTILGAQDHSVLEEYACSFTLRRSWCFSTAT